MSMLVSDELNHYGVKGMKWGVRRAINPRTRRVKPTPAASAGRRKEFNSLSNQELQGRINRLNMEKQYASLLRENELRTNWKKRAVNNVSEFLLGQGDRELNTVSTMARNAGRDYVLKAVTG